ncbi:hypothetical protein C8R44DRAFT_855941 [Mycena epipterygia]|nr:hypothetical protein C8R44DRAFT_855941 [Mycena epipterygia]
MCESRCSAMVADPTKTTMGGARTTEPGSNVPAEGSTLSGQLQPPRDYFSPGAQTVCRDNPSLNAKINGDNQAINADTGDTSNTITINGSAPLPFDRAATAITIHGGQGGNGGEGGGTGGAGGVGQGNQVQIHLAGHEIILNVYYGSRDRELDFVWDMAIIFDRNVIKHGGKSTRSTLTLVSDFMAADMPGQRQSNGSVTGKIRKQCMREHNSNFHATVWSCLCGANPADVTVRLLRNVPAITTLCLDFLGSSGALFSALTIRPGVFGPLLCPVLTALEWGDQNDTMNRAAFVDMVESRWRVLSGSQCSRLRFVRVYPHSVRMKGAKRRMNGRMQDFVEEGMDAIILAAWKGWNTMERWREY